MRKHFDEKLYELKDKLLLMSNVVEKVIDLAINSFLNKDKDLANEVFELEKQTDSLELEIENMCMELLVLQHPLAKDLRFISSILKIITDLERIADHGVNIAEVAIKMADESFIKPLIDLPKMAEITKEMIKESINSFINENKKLAINIANKDDIIDKLYEDIYTELLEMLSKDINIMNQVVNLLFVGRYIERIADHSTNICESTIYLVTGERVEF